MSSEIREQKKPIIANAASVAAFPVGMAAFGGVKSVIRNGGVKAALDSRYVEGFKALRKGLDKDCFSRGLVLANNYDQYSNLAKTATKLSKTVKKGDIGIKDKIFNIFRKEKVTIDTIKDRSAEANQALETAKTSLKNGEQIVSQTGEAIKSGFGQNVGSLIKKGFKDPFVWAFTALETVPEIFKTVIPTFKEKGFAAGMKEAGKTALKAVGNVGTYVASSAVGRVVGSAIGTLFCPGAGSAVGGNIGSMIAVSLGNILKGKIFKPKEEAQIAQPPQTTPQQKNFYA